MMRKALIEGNGRVAQVEAADDVFEVSPPFFWVECPEWVAVDDWYVDGEFKPRAEYSPPQV